MIVFLAIPTEGRSHDDARHEADLISSMLSKEGHNVCSPFNNYYGKDATYEDKLAQNISMALHSDAVYYAPGWGNSTECSCVFDVIRNYNLKRQKHGLKTIKFLYGENIEQK